MDYTESDRKGRAVCQVWQSGIHNEIPTEKNLSGQESPWGTFAPPPPPLKKGVRGQQSFPIVTDSVKEDTIYDSLSLAGGRETTPPAATSGKLVNCKLVDRGP